MARSHKDDRSAATSGGSKRQRLKNKLKFWSHSDEEGSDRDVPEPEGSAGSDASASRRDSGASSRRRSRESGERRRSTARGGHDADHEEGDDVGGDGPAPEHRSRRRRIKDKLKSHIPFVGHSTNTSTSSSGYAAEQAAKAKKAKEDDVPEPDDGGGGAGPSGTGGGVTFEDDGGSPREDYYGGRPGAAAAAAGAAGGAAVPSAFGSGGDGGFGVGPPPPSDDAYLGGRPGSGGGSGIGTYPDGPLRTSGEPGWDPAVSPAAVATALSAAKAVTRAFEAGSPAWPYDDLSLQQLFQKIGEGVIASALAATKMTDNRGGGGGGGGGSGSGVDPDRVAGRPPPLSPSYRLGGGAGMGGRPSGSGSGGGGAYVSRSVASRGAPPRADSVRSTISSSSGGSRRGHRARVPNVGSGGTWRATGTRKALLIGIRYDGKALLPGTLNDVAMLVSTLSSVASFHRKNMVILSDGELDVGHGSRTGPATRASILAEMHKLVDGSSAGDSLFVHFSGHGSQVADVSASGGATETDGMDETLVPSDWKTAGMVVDDEVYRALIEPLPAGVRLTACFDACNSGTAADLPYTFRAVPASDAGGAGGAGGSAYTAIKVDALVEARTGRPLRAAKADKRSTHGTGGVGGPGPAGEAIVFSACADGETAAGTTVLSSDGTPAGAMTTAWVKAMRAGGRGAWKDLTYTQLLGRMSRTVRQAAPAQEARLSVSMPDFHPDCRVRL